MIIKSIVIPVTTFILSTSAHAALINYDESIDGDISSRDFLLDSSGGNVFRGTVAFGSDFPFRDDDTYDVHLAAGVNITGYSISFTNPVTTGLSNIGYLNSLESYDSNISFESYTKWNLLDGYNPIITFQPPYIGTTFGFLRVNTAQDTTGDGSTVLTGPDYSSLVDWKVVITTTAPAVPVPAAVWLFGSGLLGLIGLARRKQA